MIIENSQMNDFNYDFLPRRLWMFQNEFYAITEVDWRRTVLLHARLLKSQNRGEFLRDPSWLLICRHSWFNRVARLARRGRKDVFTFSSGDYGAAVTSHLAAIREKGVGLFAWDNESQSFGWWNRFAIKILLGSKAAWKVAWNDDILNIREFY